MEIKFDKQKDEGEKAGDLIKFDDGVVGLVLEDECVVLLKHSGGSDWFELSEKVYLEEFKRGRYKILAKAKDWEIHVK